MGNPESGPQPHDTLRDAKVLANYIKRVGKAGELGPDDVQLEEPDEKEKTFDVKEDEYPPTEEGDFPYGDDQK